MFKVNNKDTRMISMTKIFLSFIFGIEQANKGKNEKCTNIIFGPN